MPDVLLPRPPRLRGRRVGVRLDQPVVTDDQDQRRHILKGAVVGCLHDVAAVPQVHRGRAGRQVPVQRRVGVVQLQGAPGGAEVEDALVGEVDQRRQRVDTRPVVDGEDLAPRLARAVVRRREIPHQTRHRPAGLRFGEERLHDRARRRRQERTATIDQSRRTRVQHDLPQHPRIPRQLEPHQPRRVGAVTAPLDQQEPAVGVLGPHRPAVRAPLDRNLTRLGQQVRAGRRRGVGNLQRRHVVQRPPRFDRQGMREHTEPGAVRGVGDEPQIEGHRLTSHQGQ